MYVTQKIYRLQLQFQVVFLTSQNVSTPQHIVVNKQHTIIQEDASTHLMKEYRVLLTRLCQGTDYFVHGAMLMSAKTRK